MAAVPQRPAVARVYRAALSWLERYTPLPRLNPSWWTLSTMVASVAYMYAENLPLRVSLVGFALIADWLDGATARQQDRVSREGYLVDVFADRFSEALIFAGDISAGPVPRVFFLLWLLNTGLTVYSVTSERHRILPLRFAYLLLLPTGVI